MIDLNPAYLPNFFCGEGLRRFESRDQANMLVC